MKYFIKEIKKANRDQGRKYLFLFLFVIFYNVFMLNKTGGLINPVVDILYINFKGMEYIDKNSKMIVISGYWIANNLLWLFIVSSYINDQLHNGWQKIIRVGKKKWHVALFIVLFFQSILYMCVQILGCFITRIIMLNFKNNKYWISPWAGTTRDMVISLLLLTFTYFVVAVLEVMFSIILNEKIGIIIAICIEIITIFIPKGVVYIGNLLMLIRSQYIKSQYIYLLVIEIVICCICMMVTVLGNTKREWL